MKMEKEACALCGQAVILDGFTLTHSKGIKNFCCGGCLSIFRLLHQTGEAIPIKNNPANNTNNEEST